MTAERIRALHAEGVPRVEIAAQVGVTPERVRQITSKRTPEELELSSCGSRLDRGQETCGNSTSGLG